MKKNLKKKKGFTLIELIIVIAILGILAAIAIPKFGSAQKDAKIKADISTAKTIADTAAMLVAKGTLTPGTSYDDFTEVGSDIYDEMNGFDKDTESQYKKEDFKVKIDGDGNVMVKIGDTEVYPKGADPYN